MRKIITQLTVLLLLLSSQQLFAQRGGYWLTAYNSTYADLSGAGVTAVSGSSAWDTSDLFSATIGFNFMIDTSNITTVKMRKGNSICVDTMTVPILEGFFALDATLIDRGTLSGSLSPISSQVTGSAGSRIFVLEVKNAGFSVEQSKYSTNADYVSYQIWLYEGTNVVEIHYGASQVSHAGDYFPLEGGSPLMGFSKRKNLTGSGAWYPATGINTSLSSISLGDSVIFTNHNVSANAASGLLGGLPPSGTVLKFTPLKASVKNVNVSQARVYPTLCTSNLMVDYLSLEPTGYEVISLKGIPITMSGTLENGTTDIDISRLAAGVYILKMQNSTGTSVQKFVKL
jgi:hypothetical protein